MEDELMVTFQAAGRQLDLRIPGTVPVGELLGMLGEALRIQVSPDSRLQAEPLGRILDNAKTLAEEEVTQGSMLTMI